MGRDRARSQNVTCPFQSPETSVLLEEAEQRIAAALRRILTPEPVQLFDDLYEDLAC